MANVHGTGLLLDGFGVMLRGRSGAGKSLLALQLLDTWRDRGRTALLVADDRIDLGVWRGRLVMAAPASIAGLIELRGRGIVTRPSVERARVDLVVDMGGELIRFVEEDALVTEIDGVRVARCPLPERGVIDATHQILLVSEALAALARTRKTPPAAASRPASKK